MANSFEAPIIPPASADPAGATPLDRTPISPDSASYLSDMNKPWYEKATDKVRGVMDSAHEVVYKIPGVNRVVGKMEIAYNQFWADRHETKSAELKAKMGGFDMSKGALDDAAGQIRSVMADLRAQNIPGIESLEIKLRDIENKKRSFDTKKDKIQSKLEARDNKVKGYINERDGIADRLIASYDEKIKPLNEKLDNIQTTKNKMELCIAVQEAQHSEQLRRLTSLEQKKKKIVDGLRLTGMTDSQIQKFEAVTVLDGLVKEGKEKVQKEKLNIAKRRAAINAKVAKVDKKANPYRDRREEFIRIKAGRPVNINIPERQRSANFQTHEEVTSRPRGDSEASPSDVDNSDNLEGGEDMPGDSEEFQELKNIAQEKIREIDKKWSKLPEDVNQWSLIGSRTHYLESMYINYGAEANGKSGIENLFKDRMEMVRSNLDPDSKMNALTDLVDELNTLKSGIDVMVVSKRENVMAYVFSFTNYVRGTPNANNELTGTLINSAFWKDFADEAGLRSNPELDFDDFGNILGRYLTLKRVPEATRNAIGSSLGEFERVKITS